ncbi:ProP Permease of the major facilitator superfamily [Pyrenophora tritici-repentis]|uniref:ProP, Permease major facilitator superfamily n=1 Tax=Pyrenophora tritici-repentis TaxID=45151 RepID=A0A2W1DDZ7_9PLEO|nr:MFS transporter [Pyrenophora tritici-repentis]KAF7565339.1 ProP, Permease major facilitator superfamily [Pyrenophora tritici-repentis]KAG9380526.1 MFS transporter [Pyrenophora tritici-repentis]KAI0573423.1 MFS transporter [Pyrenophora tritici-repentis]KAI0582074.1 MFS transporter [Pyrenophora tritici-repentis]
MTSISLDTVRPAGTNPDLAETQQSEEQPATKHIQGWALASLTIAFMSICFVLAIDNTILATAIPQITSDFQSLNDIGWYGSSYLIAQMALLPTCGRLYAFFNIKWVYCLSLAIFEIGSVISAVAPNSMALIIGRSVSGLGAAGLVSGTTTILSYCVSLKTQAMISPMVLGVYNIGSAIGPLLGGSITDNKALSWRFIFWINLPFGSVGLVLVWFTLKKPPPAVKGGIPWIQKLHQLDFPGAILLLGATSCLNLALQWGGVVYPWSNAKVFGCLIGFGLLLITFVSLQYRDKESSTIPLRIFRSRTVSASCGFMMLVQVAIVLHSYYWPIYFQSVRNTSARDSGISLLPLIVSNSLGTLCAGTMVSRYGHYVPFMWTGPLILAAGGGLYQMIRADSPRGHWIGFQILSGLGYGICSQMPILAVQVVLSKSDIPTGLVMVMFFQMLGGALAPSVGQNLFTDALLRNLRKIQGIDGTVVVAAGARGFREIVPPELLNAVVDSFNSALRHVFWVALAAPALAWVLSWVMEWRQLNNSKKQAVQTPT